MKYRGLLSFWNYYEMPYLLEVFCLRFVYVLEPQVFVSQSNYVKAFYLSFFSGACPCCSGIRSGVLAGRNLTKLFIVVPDPAKSSKKLRP